MHEISISILIFDMQSVFSYAVQCQLLSHCTCMELINVAKATSTRDTKNMETGYTPYK
uniref:Uncharacterized protein n=1 Tax=Anguilla anguilla TaxID=7936 RepID=A0A0E9QAR1_ANGAN